jgi:cytochrome c peroxidase
MSTTTRQALVLIAAALAAFPSAAEDALRTQARQQFGALQPAPDAHSAAMVGLGRALFWDTRVSGDGKTACASCHAADAWGADARRVPIDARGKPMGRNAPTVFNAQLQPALRWLADRKSGAQLAEGLITGPIGFASKQEAVDKLAALGYQGAFRAAFPQDAQPISAANYAKALESYQASLVTPAPFDRWLAGAEQAMTARQKAGLQKFIAAGCGACHGGPLFGGTSVQKFGLARDYWTETGSQSVDTGLFAVTKKEEDKYRFRVPMLRNVARTSPYFHDGSVASLERAVQVMAATQLGQTMDGATAADIAAFLDALTGERPSHFSAPAY